MTWYTENYVNRRDWILEYAELLNLTKEELVCVLMIDYFNSNHLEITQTILCKKLSVKQEELDKILGLLSAKRYLSIQVVGGKVDFSLNGLFETKVARVQTAINATLFDLFESEFGRPLSQNEMEELNKWIREMDSKLITYALKEASMYNAVNFKYIGKILRTWKEKGVTVEKIEKGDSIESE